MRRLTTWLAALALAACVASQVSACRDRTPLRIGVLLPLSGTEATEQDTLLDWAADSLNSGGGIGGRRVELVYKDTGGGGIEELAQQLVDDPSIRVVIGPATSDEVYRVAPMFVKRRKLLISPSATAGDILRAFGKKRFFVRTCPSDVAQTRTIVHLLSSRGAGRFSLIYEDDAYGRTFSEWAGFFATEKDIQLVDVVALPPERGDVSAAVGRALAGDPDYVVVAAFAQNAASVRTELDRRGSTAKLLLTDAAETQYLLDELGAASEGIELVSPSADPGSGFDEAFREVFGYAPWDDAAPTYDAFLLAVCALAADERAAGGQDLGGSLDAVISARGRIVRWDAPAEAVDAVLKGENPDIAGASGPLEFDSEFGVDPLRAFYAIDRVGTVDGVRDFQTTDTLDTEESRASGTLPSGVSAGRTAASARHSDLETRGASTYDPGAKDDAWAVVVATSVGWEDYRHQADALAVYDLLKRNGFADDRIVLFSADDVPDSPQNPRKGDVHHTIGGKNLRAGAVIDYAGERVTVANLEAVLLGARTPETTSVLETDEHSNVFLYIVDHGEPGGIIFEADRRDRVLSANRLADTLREMTERKRYRQMLVVTEVCFGESLVLGADPPGVLFLSGAAANERSFAADYDPETDAWLADDFTSQFLECVSRRPDVSLAGLYEDLYGRVAGSHIRVDNQRRFGDVYGTPASDFLSP